MTYLNPICADVGTRNCPCPLAETGDCLVCSRLSGRGACDCRWVGVCVYNEYIQNGSKVRARREDRSTRILQRLQRGDDLLLLQLAVPRGFALEASQPGSFLFLKAPRASELTNVPVSVMAADAEHGSIWIALKILSAKTKALAACEDFLEVRGVYRSGLLGKGLAGMQADGRKAGGKTLEEKPLSEPSGAKEDPDEGARTKNIVGESWNPNTDAEKNAGAFPSSKRWLVLTKGVGFAPAVNLIRWAAGRIDIHVIADPEKVGEDVIREQFHAWQLENDPIHLQFQSLAKLLDRLEAASPCMPLPAADFTQCRSTDSESQKSADSAPRAAAIELAPAAPLPQTAPHAPASTVPALHTSDSHAPALSTHGTPADHPTAPTLQQTNYDRIFLLASDYYIKRLSAAMKIPPEKLIFCNNFHLCCGEGICGACGHVDAAGNLSRMCKCREFSAQDLLLPEI